jgi:hypothetical protein
MLSSARANDGEEWQERDRESAGEQRFYGRGARAAAIPLIIDMQAAIATMKVPMLVKNGLWTAAVGIAVALLVLQTPATLHAGPPYVTDDPEPVETGHWEFYLATQHALTRPFASGTAPHAEVNYGLLPGLQLHVIAPLAYAHRNHETTFYGAGDVELGAKLRFVDEGPWTPMVGTFPMFELPVGNASKGLGTGHLHVLVPLWLQKSFGPWTTYGGGGYWRNPGEDNRDFWYLGWLIQRRLTEGAALGTEVFYTTPDQVGAKANLRFNVGLVLDLSPHHHVLSSAGRGLVGDCLFEGYLAYQLTL